MHAIIHFLLIPYESVMKQTVGLHTKIYVQYRSIADNGYCGYYVYTQHESINNAKCMTPQNSEELLYLTLKEEQFS